MIGVEGPEEKEDLNVPDNTSEHTLGQSDREARGSHHVKRPSIMKLSSNQDVDNRSCFVKMFSCGNCKSNV